MYQESMHSRGRASPTNPHAYARRNSCHGHYHTEDALRYLLLNIDSRSTVVFGKKSSYCIEDSNQLAGFIGPNVQCAGHSSCDYQGLQSGWEDVYGPGE